MELAKKHIGGLYDCRGSDGSWAYQLIDVKKGELLFYVFGSLGRYEIDSAKTNDWRPFKPQPRDPVWDLGGWETARRAK